MTRQAKPPTMYKACPVCGRVRAVNRNRSVTCASCHYFAKAVRPGDWVDQAVCTTVDPELFWVEDRHQAKKAQEICMKCPVIAECLAYALDTNQSQGIWGGLTPSGRHQYAQLMEVV